MTESIGTRSELGRTARGGLSNETSSPPRAQYDAWGEAAFVALDFAVYHDDETTLPGRLRHREACHNFIRSRTGGVHGFTMVRRGIFLASRLHGKNTYMAVTALRVGVSTSVDDVKLDSPFV